MPTDNQQPPLDPPRPTNLTQADLDLVVATVLQALERHQRGALGPPQADLAGPAVTPPAPLRGPARRLYTPAEDPHRPAGLAQGGGVEPQGTSLESAAESIPRDPLKGKAPLIEGNTGIVSAKSPFTSRILDEEVPRRFRTHQFADYTGVMDPEDHVGRFENAASLHQYTDAIRCRVFSTTLSGSALRWFSRLPPASIGSFEEFKDLFLQHFSTSRTYCKTTTDLFATKQGPKESLKDFVRRFNRVAQDVPDATSPVLISAFAQGILEGDFFRSLIKKPPVNYDVLQSRAVKYIHVEEAQSSRRKETNVCPSGPSRETAGSYRPEKRPPPQLQRRPQVEHHPTPMQSSPRAINAVAGRAGQVVGNRRWLPRFCAFHNTQSHDLSECYQYARKLRQEADQRASGRPTHRAAQTPPRQPLQETRPPSPRPARQRDRSPRRPIPPLRQPAPASPEIRSQREAPEDDQNNAPLRRINMIVGGAIEGDSYRTRKAGARQPDVCEVSRGSSPKSPVIFFGPQDLEGVEAPHDDALVIRATVANYDIGRVFVDTGSSVNVLFVNTFQQMDINEGSLTSLTTPLYGFTGNEVQPLGQITLPISLGEPP
ncbi:uncharacterized protein LOC141819598 [Curcuma longa]|uniref:uncharacterized protein LOC141819598 n=1 Tax=Curcuma longa TaxID=136217 RepID=UPI003D9E7F72